MVFRKSGSASAVAAIVHRRCFLLVRPFLLSPPARGHLAFRITLMTCVRTERRCITESAIALEVLFGSCRVGGDGPRVLVHCPSQHNPPLLIELTACDNAVVVCRRRSVADGCVSVPILIKCCSSKTCGGKRTPLKGCQRSSNSTLGRSRPVQSG